MILEYPIHFLKNMDHTLFNCIIPRRFDHLVSQLPKDWSSSGFVQLNVSHKQIMFRIDERPYNLVGINSADLLLLSFYNPLLLWSSIIVLRQKPEPLTCGLCVYIIYQYKKRIKKCLFTDNYFLLLATKSPKMCKTENGRLGGALVVVDGDCSDTCDPESESLLEGQ